MDVEFPLLTVPDQKSDIALAIVTEGEIRAQPDLFQIHMIEQSHQELTGRDSRYLAAERKDAHHVRPHRPQDTRFGGSVRELRALRPEDDLGARIESEDDRLKIECAGALHHLADQHLMATMDAVERADRDDRRSPALQLRQVTHH